ncbi:MAG TPA: Ig-like domain repeat protein [Candidatus Sulfotelmatobacter sp.]|nr:Ig-like domain repeat protein [Candidatus Sulfotelmatobacter sp.]
MRPRPVPATVLSIVKVTAATSQRAITRLSHVWLLLLILCLQTTPSSATDHRSEHAVGLRGFKTATTTYLSLPLSFEANQGQTDPRVNYLSRGSAYTVFLTSEEAVLQLRAHPKKNDGTVLRMKLLGASGNAEARGWDELPGKANYFIGSDPEKWHADVPTYGKVGYRGIYPGVDLVYYGNQGQLEYDFMLSPGTDPGSIAIQFAGAAAEISSNGDLVLHIDGGEVRFRRPVAYQLIPSSKRNGSHNKRFVQSRFTMRGIDRVGFEVASYDHSRPLVIDPVLVYSTYLGGSFPDEAMSVAVDSFGAAYVTGLTCSADFPVTTGAFQTTHKGSGGACPSSQNSFEDTFVTKFNSAGTHLVYSTYIGGSASDRGYDIAVDSSGNAYIAGQTQSGDYPTTSGAFITTCPGGVGGCNTGVVTKLNSSGSKLLYSTYLGGNANMGSTGIAVNSSGEAYVTGSTDGTFPTTAGAFQATNPRNGAGLSVVFAVLNAAGSACVYCTFLGGAQGHSYNPGSQAFGVAIDSKGLAYITGWTDSPDFPTTTGAFQTKCGSDGNCNGLWDAFVAKLDPTKSGTSSLVYSTFLGGSGTDIGFGIAVDALGNAYVTGTTGGNVNSQFGGSPSKDFPTTAGAFQATCPGTCAFDSAWVTKLNATGTALVYSTYLGGGNGNTDSGVFGPIAVDSAFNVYETGFTAATNFPTKNPIQATNGGTFDAFVTTLNPTGSGLVFSTYLGGNNIDTAASLALDQFANVYVTGSTSSTNFPHTTGAFQTTCPGSCTFFHGFVSKIGRFNTSTALSSSLNPSLFGQSITFTATVTSMTATAVAPSGTVTFKNGTTTLGTATLVSGSAKFTTSKLAVGAHSITAVYGGDKTFIGSTSPTFAQTVNKAGTTTTLTATPNPSQFNQPVTFKAVVKSATGAIPAGSVTFKDGTTTLRTVTLTSGTATLSISKLVVGAHSITASYAGNANFVASISSTLTQTVSKAKTTTTLTSAPNPSSSGQAVTFTATVTGAFGGIPGGTVTFKDGTTIIGTGAVSTTTRQAKLATSKLAVGTHNITAAYSGNTNYLSSTSAVVKQVVQ